MEKLKITIKTLYGFEELLKEELAELGYNEVELLNRAVQVEGDWEDVYRLNYRCRLAISVLVEVKSFTIHKEDDLYKKAKKIDWTSYFDIDKTFAVKGAVFSTLFNHTQYPVLLVKDAIADVFRDKFGKRPDVNIKSPQVMFDVYIKDKSVVISLNTSGVPLFQRGYRQATGEAPMNEVLAAGILRASGWDRKSTLIDLMCGSGTIAIEAALWAADIPAMIERTHYAFKNFTSFQPEAWEKVMNEGNNRPIDLGFDILAYDIDSEAILNAKRNSRVAPIGRMIKFELQDALTVEAPDSKGTIICNPPYGERIGEDVAELYEKLGDLFKNAFIGYDCWLVSSNMEALKHVGLRPSKKIKVFNGNLECSLRLYQIFEGTIKEQYQSDDSEDKVETKSEAKLEEPKTEPAPIKRREPRVVSKRIVKEEEPKPSEEREIPTKKVEKTKPDLPNLGASKYGQKPRFLKDATLDKKEVTPAPEVKETPSPEVKETSSLDEVKPPAPTKEKPNEEPLLKDKIKYLRRNRE